MILLLTSMNTSAEQDETLAKLIGKTPQETKVAYIENAYDIYNDEASLIEGREIIKNKGYQVELVDLRNWKTGRDGGGRGICAKNWRAKICFCSRVAIRIICAG